MTVDLSTLTKEQRFHYDEACTRLAYARTRSGDWYEAAALIHWLRGSIENSGLPLSAYGTTEEELTALDRSLNIWWIQSLLKEALNTGINYPLNFYSRMATQHMTRQGLTFEDIGTTPEAVATILKEEYKRYIQHCMNKLMASLREAHDDVEDIRILFTESGINPAEMALNEVFFETLQSTLKAATEMPIEHPIPPPPPNG